MDMVFKKGMECSITVDRSYDRWTYDRCMIVEDFDDFVTIDYKSKNELFDMDIVERTTLNKKSIISICYANELVKVWVVKRCVIETTPRLCLKTGTFKKAVLMDNPGLKYFTSKQEALENLFWRLATNDTDGYVEYIDIENEHCALWGEGYSNGAYSDKYAEFCKEHDLEIKKALRINTINEL